MSVFPTEVKVGAMTYKVVVVPDLFADRSLFGEVLYGPQTIKIAGDVSKPRQLNAFVHELYHAIKFESGDMTEQDEQHVRAISNVLTQVIVDNGWMTKKEDA